MNKQKKNKNNKPQKIYAFKKNELAFWGGKLCINHLITTTTITLSTATEKQTKAHWVWPWVPTNLRRHNSDVVPDCVFSVQRLRGSYSATDFINPEVPFVILFTVQEISVREGKPG